MTFDRPPAPGTRHRITLPAIALGACLGYYLGSVIGLQLRLPSATPSVLWPPNAILTSVLVLTFPRRWLVILLAVLPVHLFIQLQTDFPRLMVLALFCTNCAEALLGAGGMWWLSDAPWRFDTLRRLVVFFVAAAVIAPLLSSFADAAAVTWFRGEPYWHVWTSRTLSNILAELTIVPAVVGAVVAVSRGWRRRTVGHYTEAVLLALGLGAIGWLDFTNALSDIPALRVVSRQTPLALQLPFLLWAALRFGPTGAGLTLLTTTVLSAWAVVHGVGPFASIAPATTVTALTISLIVVAATLLTLATLIEERRQVQQILRVQLEFEGLLSRLAAAIVQLPGDQMTRAFAEWLGRIGRVLDFDSLTVFTVQNGAGAPQPVYSWTDDRVSGPPAAVSPDHVRWARQSMLALAPIAISDTDPAALHTTPASSSRSESVFKTGGAIPLIGEGHVLGALAFESFGTQQWSADRLANARLVGEVLASALTRKQSEDALRQSEVMKSAILQSLMSGVAVVDRTGQLLQVNEKWVLFATGCPCLDTSVGGNLIARFWAAFEAGDRLAGDVFAGVTAVLEDSRGRFAIEHRTGADASPEWWSLSAVPLNRPGGGAVITRTNITELRRAEMDAQRSRQELAHVARVSTVGELTASLAHQLNQPLTAIMTNAQAGARILDAPQPNYAEIRAILVDIVKDDRRASEVIQRLRDLLRKGELEMTKVNLAAAISDVVDLLSSEAIMRNVAIAISLDHEPMFVRGDRVQLQQVMLNLLHNAMDAMTDQSDGVRRIEVGGRHVNGRIHVAVRDSGAGLPPGTEESVFEPFYTTKASGMGMGLSIARSIIEAHGGTIRAANHPDRGAVFEVVFPRTIVD